MNLPMLRPTLEAVTFGFDRIGMMIRIAWLPIVLVIALHIWLGLSIAESFHGVDVHEIAEAETPDELAETIRGVEFDPAAAGAIAVAGFLSMFGSLLLFAPVLVAATRAATRADYEPPGGPVYFAMGPRQVRYAIAQVGYGVLAMMIAGFSLGMALLLGAVGVGAAVGEAAGEAAGPFVAALGFAGAIGVILIGLWLCLRLLPVLAIAAVEDRISFGDAWAMTKGNFWRLVLSGLFFVQLLQAATSVLFVAFVAPVFVVLALIALAMSGFVGPFAFALVGLGALVLIPAFVAVAAFALGAQAAYSGRVYAYLSGCGDDCRIL